MTTPIFTYSCHPLTIPSQSLVLLLGSVKSWIYLANCMVSISYVNFYTGLSLSISKYTIWRQRLSEYKWCKSKYYFLLEQRRIIFYSTGLFQRTSDWSPYLSCLSPGGSTLHDHWSSCLLFHNTSRASPNSMVCFDVLLP